MFIDIIIPNILYKLVLRVFDCHMIILQLLGKRVTEKKLLTGDVANKKILIAKRLNNVVNR